MVRDNFMGYGAYFGKDHFYNKEFGIISDKFPLEK